MENDKKDTNAKLSEGADADKSDSSNLSSTKESSSFSEDQSSSKCEKIVKRMENDKKDTNVKLSAGDSADVDKSESSNLSSTKESSSSSEDQSSSECEEIHPAVKRRIKALKKLQLQSTELDSQFFKELDLLERKYTQLYSPMYEQRLDIVVGRAPCAHVSDSSSESDPDYDDGLLKNVLALPIAEVLYHPGLPGFWLNILQNVKMISERIQKRDEAVLVHLINITVTLNEAEPKGFMVGFHFEPNDYFTNDVLIKEYLMECDVDKDKPFNFDGPEIYQCRGCSINWNEKKKVTVKAVLKKHKANCLQSTGIVYKPVNSFFNYFDLTSSADVRQMDRHTRKLFAQDFEMGLYIREHIVPHAFFYFSGTATSETDATGESSEFESEETCSSEYKSGQSTSSEESKKTID